MEFKFRAGDHRPPSPPPPPPQYASPRPPAVYCFAKQRFSDACLRRNTNIVTIRKPFDTNEAMQYEMELMRLREEKLLAEIERQRFLKEEARRELMLFEREMAIRGLRQSAGYSFREQHRWGTSFGAAPSPSPSPVAVVQSFNEWQKIENLKISDRLGFGAVALPPRAQPLMADDKKERQVLQADKREFIVLEKPDPNVFREKRKAETPSTSTNNIQSVALKKNRTDEWSCALCQVTVSCERTFNQHLNGKKHRRKEAGLRAQKASNSVSQALNKRRKILEVTETLGSAGAEEKEPEVGETLECEKTGEPEVGETLECEKTKEPEVGETLECEKTEEPKVGETLECEKTEEPEVGETLECEKTEEPKVGETLECEKTEASFDLNAIIPNFLKLGSKEDEQQNQIVFRQNSITENVSVGKKNFKFWCKKCKVGAHATSVMFDHINGKKHRASLQEVGQNDGDRAAIVSE